MSALNNLKSSLNIKKVAGITILHLIRALVVTVLASVLSSCAWNRAQHPAFEANDREGSVSFAEVESILQKESSAEAKVVGQVSSDLILPNYTIETPTIDSNYEVINYDGEEFIPELDEGPSTVSYNNLPISSFIHEVFGEQLGLSYSLAPELANQRDLVTLRINELSGPEELYRIARSTLRSYGVVIEPQSEGVLFFTIDRNSAGAEIPLLVSGRALPDVPDSLRPVFMFVPLEVVSNIKVRTWLSTVFRTHDIEIREDPVRNAIVLQGKPDLVRQALSIIDFLDQPLMRGRFSIAIDPVYTQAEDLVKNLEIVLQSEGFSVSQIPEAGNIVLLPMSGSNSLIVFAPNDEILEHIVEWAQTIDRRQQLSIEEGIFTYQVKNTRADHIVSLLSQLESTNNNQALRDQSVQANQNQNENEFQNRVSRYVVDENLNSIVFKGSGEEWMNMLPVIQDMDKPAPSVLVEVLIAEVTLNDQEVSGIEWLANGSVSLDGDSYTTSYGTIGGLGLGSSGFNVALDAAGQTRAVINAFYRDQRATIRSRPRLMVKSGQTATIDVGSEVPIITSESRSFENSDSPIVQSVQYRQTGLALTITPTVHASGYVDIEISQSLSESRLTTTSTIDSPTIFNRSLQTAVTLRDGGSVLLGGLVSASGSQEDRGVPFVGKLPLVGKLFRSDNETQDRTDLMVLIVPYVLETVQDAIDLTEVLREDRQLDP